MSSLKPAIKALNDRFLRSDLPAFRVGDTVRVNVKIKEGEKERVQAFEGVVIKKHDGDARATFTVRKVSYGVGVERIFPLHSPRIDTLEIISQGRVRRNRLYYLRGRAGKAARIKSRANEPAAPAPAAQTPTAT